MMMNIIDFHAHIFPDNIAGPALSQLAEHSGEYQPRTDGTLSGLLASMDRAGIAMSVISNIATKPSQSYPIFNFCSAIQSERIYPLISLHPHNTMAEVKDLLDKARGKGIKGVKFHPMYQNFSIDNETMFPFYEMIMERDFFVILHTGYDIAFPGNMQADLERVRKIAGAFDNLKIVVTHTGGWRQWDRVGLVADCDNVFTETSMTQTEVSDEFFIKTLSFFDENRIFFGTDSPWTDQKEMVQKVLNLKIADSVKEKLLYTNAASFLAQ